MLEQCRNFINNIPLNLNYITPACLYESIQKTPNKYFILDTRDAASYEHGHISGSINIFFRDILLPNNMDKLPHDKTIVICCWVGHTASQLLTILQLLGYDAIGLKYGMGKSAIEGEEQKGWEHLKLPVEHK